LLILIAGIFLIGCKDKEPEKKVDPFASERDSLMRIMNSKDSTVNSFINSFNEIESNLDSVKSHQSLITLSSKDKGELSSNAKDRINENIRMINELMDENKKKLAYLGEMMRQSDIKIGSLEKMINTLKSELISKDSELVVLNKQLMAVNANVV